MRTKPDDKLVPALLKRTSNTLGYISVLKFTAMVPEALVDDKQGSVIGVAATGGWHPPPTHPRRSTGSLLPSNSDTRIVKVLSPALVDVAGNRCAPKFSMRYLEAPPTYTNAWLTVRAKSEKELV
jgi:hypothetical protein